MPNAKTKKPKQHPAQANEYDLDALSPTELLTKGQEALDTYDYDLARRALTLAHTRDDGPQTTLALLSLLIDHLADDQTALALAPRLDPRTAKHPQIRALLAIAAARQARRKDALAFLEGTREARAAEALTLLARQALAHGHLDDAAHDLTRARALDPAHGERRELEDTLAARRAAERRPLEDELTALLAQKRFDDAASRADALIARYSDSEVARRALRAIEEHKRHEQATRLITEAQSARDRGEIATALALAQQALTIDPRGPRAAQAQTLADEIEADARAQHERAQVDKTEKLLGIADTTDGLIAYLALETHLRAQVRERVDSPLLAWLEEMGAPAGAIKARTAALAALALARAEQMIERDPEAALALLDAQGIALAEVSRAKDITARAQQRIGEQRREDLRRGVEAARAAFEAGALDEAQARIDALTLRELPDGERAEAEALAARVARALEKRHRVRELERLRHEPAPLQARAIAERLCAEAEGDERDRWAQEVHALDNEVQRAFRVHVYDEPLPADRLWDLDIEPIRGTPRWLMADGREIVLTQAYGPWIFIRVLDIEARRFRVSALLRAPGPVNLIRAEVHEDRLFVADRHGFVLELALDGMRVRSCYKLASDLNVPPDSPDAARMKRGAQVFGITIDDIQIVEGGRWLWLFDCFAAGKPAVRLFDTVEERFVRQLYEGERDMGLQVVYGLASPCVMVTCNDSEVLSAHDARGMPLGPRIKLPSVAATITAYPGGESLFVLTADLDAINTQGDVPLGWVELRLDGSSPQADTAMDSPEPLPKRARIIEGLSRQWRIGTAADTSAGRVFVAFKTIEKTAELAGFEAPGPGVELSPLFRVRTPFRTFLMQDRDAQRVITLAVREESFEVCALGGTAPSLTPDDLGLLNTNVLKSRTMHCFEPKGALERAVRSLEEQLERTPRRRWTEFMYRARDTNNPEYLFALSLALHRHHHPIAGELGGLTWRRFPNYVPARVSQADSLSNVRQWQEALDLLTGVDMGALDDGTARHCCHLKGHALLRLQRHDEALEVLRRGLEFPGGACNLNALIALAAPLEGPLADVMEWDPEQRAVRALVRAVRDADACLEAGDARGAIAAMDRSVVWDGQEVQSLARRAAAWLEVEAADTEATLRKAIALSSLCAAHGEKAMFMRSELPFPSGHWEEAKLDALCAQARAWLDSTFGGPIE